MIRVVSCGKRVIQGHVSQNKNTSREGEARLQRERGSCPQEESQHLRACEVGDWAPTSCRIAPNAGSGKETSQRERGSRRTFDLRTRRDPVNREAPARIPEWQVPWGGGAEGAPPVPGGAFRGDGAVCCVCPGPGRPALQPRGPAAGTARAAGALLAAGGTAGAALLTQKQKGSSEGWCLALSQACKGPC